MKKILIGLLFLIGQFSFATELAEHKAFQYQKIGQESKIVDSDFFHIKDYWNVLMQMHLEDFLNKGDYNGTVLAGVALPFVANVTRKSSKAEMTAKIWMIHPEGNGYVKLTVYDSANSASYPLGVFDVESNITFTGFNTKLKVEKGASTGKQVITYSAIEPNSSVDGQSITIIRKVYIDTTNQSAYGASSENNGTHTLDFNFSYDANYMKIDNTYFDRNSSDANETGKIALFDAQGQRALVYGNVTTAPNCNYTLHSDGSISDGSISNDSECSIEDAQTVSLNGIDYTLKVAQINTTITSSVTVPSTFDAGEVVTLDSEYIPSTVHSDIGEPPVVTKTANINAVIDGKIQD